MTREFVDKTLVHLMGNKNGYLSSALIYRLKQGKYPRISEYFKSRYESFNDYKETFIRMKEHIEEHPVCKFCGKPTRYNLIRYRSDGYPYSLYCCSSCSAKDLDRIYKSRETKKERYGSSGYNNREKARKTCLEKYGVDNPKKSEDVKRKSEDTCLKRYGVRCPTQMRSVVEYTHSKECIAKQNNTKRTNHTFNTSKTEEFLYKELIRKYGKNDVVRQYADKERYPYNCDFYIPSIDTFIELNAHWTHGNHPYDPDSIEDQQKVKEWKSRGTRYYDNAIRTWTISDVKKREIAKKNNLNYVEIFSSIPDEILKDYSILGLNKNRNNNGKDNRTEI